MSDDYSPEEIDAQELLKRWADGARKKFSNGLIPITWSVSCVERAKFEALPFQFDTDQDFLSHYEWPIRPETGERLDWLSLPVEDKQWNRLRANKGGFIQEATGWKPSILQPFVYLPSLVQRVR